MLKHQETVLPIFVYGTLMVGERNYIDVLHKNLTHYEDAKVKGKLYYYKKEDYPALMKGEHWIDGQLFYVNQLHDVLKPLDQIEGYISDNHPNNMYDREVIEVITKTGKSQLAYVYRISPNLFQQQQHEFSLISESSWKMFNQKRCL